MKMLVTGATGQLGALVVEALLKTVPAENVAVSVRDPQKAAHLKAQGVDVRQGDFTKPETLIPAFAGIDRLLIISSAPGDRVAQHKAAIKAAQENNVRFIAYTSVANAQESPFFIAEDHRETEKAILETGIPYSFLRNNWYLENELGTIQAVANGAPWVTSAGTGKTGWASRQDYAEAAAAILSGEGHENTTYELSGKPITQEELAGVVSEVIGRTVEVQQVDDATYEKVMAGAGVPEAMLPFVVGVQQGIREGYLDVASSDFEKVLGRPVTPLKDAVSEILNEK
ncbi:NAD(P)H dehydrogenase (quinone) [Evansella caseinilytica]|uniref:NAD(P)H dehydrogenase (Quinone) n=1 Tax=Evansella caseinilytica TaxID=1503961 RepID=A0A1H3SNF6_9BACI|nr:SDR family oxidoreductase [Evansella caseinilytica]SDZ39198.1 NAD(P)H dehydrogenase (quinone) [Evansella caseinilytica]